MYFHVKTLEASYALSFCLPPYFISLFLFLSHLFCFQFLSFLIFKVYASVCFPLLYDSNALQIQFTGGSACFSLQF